MTWNPYPPLPVGPLRDLLGVTRAMYRYAETESPRDEARLEALEDVGRTLRRALERSKAHPGTIDHGEAWAAAQRATKALGELVEGRGELALIVAATARVVAVKRSTMT